VQIKPRVGEACSLTANIVVTLVLTIWLALAIASLVASYRFKSYLKAVHPSLWEELGSPHIIANSSLKNLFAMQRFLKSLPSSDIADPELVRRGRAHVLIGKAYLVSFATVLVFMTYVLVHR
jgi:hypothetical protein